MSLRTIFQGIASAAARNSGVHLPSRVVPENGWPLLLPSSPDGFRVNSGGRREASSSGRKPGHGPPAVNRRRCRRPRRRTGREPLPDARRRQVDPGACPFCDAPSGLPLTGPNGQVWIVSLMNRTDPSPIRTLSPPGCMLDAELVQAVIEAAATLSQALGG